MKTRRILRAPADTVWEVLEDFGAMAAWSPDLAASAQTRGRGLEIGAVRELAFTRPRRGSTGVTERVIDVGDRWFSYVLDGDLSPFTDAGSRWMVDDHPQGCLVTVESHLHGDSVWTHVLAWTLYPVLRRGLKRALRGLEARAQSFIAHKD